MAVYLSIACRLMARLDYCYPYLHHLYCHLCRTIHSYHSYHLRHCQPNQNYPLECLKKKLLLLVQVDRDKSGNSSVQTVEVNNLALKSVFADLAVDSVHVNWVEKHKYAVVVMVDNHLIARLLDF